MAKHKDCVICIDTIEEGERHLTLFVCGKCSGKPAWCSTDCFTALIKM